jgi:hypothetical protein
MLKFLTQTLPGIRYFSFWVLLFGIVIYTIGYFKIGDLPNYWIWVYDFLKTGGSVFMSSAVFMGIVKSYQFTGIFKEELRKVVYAEDHLEKRNDLETIWEKITLQLCKQKFKKISTQLQKIIKEYYLPIDHDYYYKDYKIETIIEYDTENEGYIKITEETVYKLITDDIDCVDLKFSSVIPFPSNDEEKTTYQLQELTLNDVDVPYTLGNELKVKRTKTNLNISFNTKIDCKSTNKDYIVTRKDVKIYNLESNPFRSHSAVWLYENLELNLTYPKEMQFEWLNVGALGKWKVEPSVNIYGRKLKARYNGLLFKNQGFLLIYK